MMAPVWLELELEEEGGELGFGDVRAPPVVLAVAAELGEDREGPALGVGETPGGKMVGMNEDMGVEERRREGRTGCRACIYTCTGGCQE